MSKVIERFSYGCGDFGCNIIYTAMSAFLLFYYTDYAGVNAFAVGTIMMVSRFFDGISDVIMGVIVDRTRSKYGKARPWLLRMCVPFALSGILLFSVPTSWASAPKRLRGGTKFFSNPLGVTTCGRRSRSCSHSMAVISLTVVKQSA